MLPDQGSEIFLLCRIVSLSGQKDLAILADHKDRGESKDAVFPFQRLAGIQNNRELPPSGIAERPDLGEGARAIQGNRDNGHADWKLFLKVVQQIQLFITIRAPRGPKIQDHWPDLEQGIQRDALSVNVLQGKLPRLRTRV